jgi:hypothetical protein
LHALLACGRSDRYGVDVSQVVDPRLQTESNMVHALVDSQSARRPFEGKTVLCILKRGKVRRQPIAMHTFAEPFPSPQKIQKDPSDKTKFFSRVSCVLGATSVHLIHDINPWPVNREASEYDFVICDNQTTLEHLEEQGATCRSLDWVKQCIIMGKAMPVHDE